MKRVYLTTGIRGPGPTPRARRARWDPFGPEEPPCLRRSHKRSFVQPWGTIGNIHTLLRPCGAGPPIFSLATTPTRVQPDECR